MCDEPSICEHCVGENELRWELQGRGEPIQKCAICGSHWGRSLPADDKRLGRILRALVRLTYSEWDYNTHRGGDSLQFLLFGDKHIFHLERGADELAFEQAFLNLASDWYPNDEQEVSLGGAYWC